jgi:hypothetical protein
MGKIAVSAKMPDGTEKFQILLISFFDFEQQGTLNPSRYRQDCSVCKDA